MADVEPINFSVDWLTGSFARDERIFVLAASKGLFFVFRPSGIKKVQAEWVSPPFQGKFQPLRALE